MMLLEVATLAKGESGREGDHRSGQEIGRDINGDEGRCPYSNAELTAECPLLQTKTTEQQVG